MFHVRKETSNFDASDCEGYLIIWFGLRFEICCFFAVAKAIEFFT